MSTMSDRIVETPRVGGISEKAGVLDGAIAGFGVSAAITIVFNTLLAWIKDAYEPLNSFMASLTGHHWRTHGLVDLALFVVLGSVLTMNGLRITGTRLAVTLTAAIIAAGGGLALWFLVT